MFFVDKSHDNFKKAWVHSVSNMSNFFIFKKVAKH